MFAPIDLYCERTDPGFWSEPVNALSNLLFIAAGIIGLAAVRRRQTGLFAEILCWWVMAIGVGSLLFHTFANGLTVWLDVVPIATLTLALSVFCLRRHARFSWPWVAIILAVYFVAISFITASIPEALRIATNGTTGYLPAWGAFVVFGSIAIWRGNRGGWYFLACSGIMLVSMTFRMIDPDICEAFPLGTHFLWHSLNALMLGVALMAVARHGAPARA